MASDRHLSRMNMGVELVRKDGYRGDAIKVFYCENEKCSYIELYRIKQKW